MALLVSFLKVRIGAMLAYTPLDEKSLALLLSYLQDFLKWVLAPERPPLVLLLASRKREPVKCCLVAGILWRTLRHFSMPATTRWLLQSTTVRPFKRLLYAFWAFGRESGVDVLNSDEDGIPQQACVDRWKDGSMEGRTDGLRRKIPESRHTRASTKLIFFHGGAAEAAPPAWAFPTRLCSPFDTSLPQAGVLVFLCFVFPRSKIVL